SPLRSVVGQVLVGDFPECLKHPIVGGGVERFVGGEVDQAGNCLHSLRAGEHARFREAASSTFADVVRWIAAEHVEKGCDRIVGADVCQTFYGPKTSLLVGVVGP